VRVLKLAQHSTPPEAIDFDLKLTKFLKASNGISS
jgi:hypothetical protein